MPFIFVKFRIHIK